MSQLVSCYHVTRFFLNVSNSLLCTCVTVSYIYACPIVNFNFVFVFCVQFHDSGSGFQFYDDLDTKLSLAGLVSDKCPSLGPP